MITTIRQAIVLANVARAGHVGIKGLVRNWGVGRQSVDFGPDTNIIDALRHKRLVGYRAAGALNVYAIASPLALKVLDELSNALMPDLKLAVEALHQAETRYHELIVTATQNVALLHKVNDISTFQMK